MTRKKSRLLAAIMFTDMVGYTALMQTDERKAKQNRDRHRKILQDSVAEHQGRILQYFGDGTMIIFNSAIEAVDCAIQIQMELINEPKIPLRIGGIACKVIQINGKIANGIFKFSLGLKDVEKEFTYFPLNCIPIGIGAVLFPITGIHTIELVPLILHKISLMRDISIN